MKRKEKDFLFALVFCTIFSAVCLISCDPSTPVELKPNIKTPTNGLIPFDTVLRRPEYDIYKDGPVTIKYCPDSTKNDLDSTAIDSNFKIKD